MTSALLSDRGGPDTHRQWDVDFESGDAVTFPSLSNFTAADTQIVVNGILTASGTTFIKPGNGYVLHQIAVNSGGDSSPPAAPSASTSSC